MADMTAYVYQKGFILTASQPFDLADTLTTKHITNLSINKKHAGYPGQVPCFLTEEYPEVCLRLGLRPDLLRHRN